MIELFVGVMLLLFLVMLESGRKNKSPGGGKRKNASAGRGTARTKGKEPVILPLVDDGSKDDKPDILPLDHDGYTEEIIDDEIE
jgi:hypothetical protein